MATLIIEHSDSAGSDRFGEVLRDYGHRIEIIRVHCGDAVPADLGRIDAIVTCGGPQSPVDDEPTWIEPELKLLRLAHEASLPVVGICLGCQLLARALGGELDRLKCNDAMRHPGAAALDGESRPESGLECGWHEVMLTPVGREDPVFAGIPWKSMQVHWHRYHVATPPEGARVLARSAGTPVQAWSLGLRTYGIQYHPEAYVETIDRWAREEPDALRDVGLTPEALRRDTERYYASFDRLARRLFESMALLVMPVDRRYGVAKEIHH